MQRKWCRSSHFLALGLAQNSRLQVGSGLCCSCEKVTLQPSFCPIRSSMEGLRAIAQSPPWCQALPHLGVMPREESFCACTSRTSLPCGLLLPQQGLSCCFLLWWLLSPACHQRSCSSTARGAVTRFTSAACLFSRPLPGGGPCAMDCSALFCFPSVCVYIFLYMHMWKRG